MSNLDNLAHKSFCFISNDNHHDAYFLFKVQSLVMKIGVMMIIARNKTRNKTK